MEREDGKTEKKTSPKATSGSTPKTQQPIQTPAWMPNKGRNEGNPLKDIATMFAAPFQVAGNSWMNQPTSRINPSITNLPSQATLGQKAQRAWEIEQAIRRAAQGTGNIINAATGWGDVMQQAFPTQPRPAWMGAPTNTFVSGDKAGGAYSYTPSPTRTFRGTENNNLFVGDQAGSAYSYGNNNKYIGDQAGGAYSYGTPARKYKQIGTFQSGDPMGGGLPPITVAPPLGSGGGSGGGGRTNHRRGGGGWGGGGGGSGGWTDYGSGYTNTPRWMLNLNSWNIR